MENLKKYKVHIGIGAALILTAISGYYFTQNTNEEISEKNNQPVTEINEFQDLNFLKENLTDEEKNEVRELIKTMSDREMIAKQMLDSAYQKNEEEFQKTWNEVEKMRALCMDKWEKFVDPNKITEFNTYFENRIQKLESFYIKK